MSKKIANQKNRQGELKAIIRDLHAGVSVEEIKKRFALLLDRIGPTEIGELEQSLINEGLAVEEIQKLCDIHVAVFKESLEKQRQMAGDFGRGVGHPLGQMKAENQKTQQLLSEIRQVVEAIGQVQIGDFISELIETWSASQRHLNKIDTHYSMKENIIFPYLERHGISGPPAVMWGIHDEIRRGLKKIEQIIAREKTKETVEMLASSELFADIDNVVLPILDSISEMIYKEEKILFPMCEDILTPDEFRDLGFQLADPLTTSHRDKELKSGGKTPTGIDLDIGFLTPEQINLVLTHLPVDITFVDANDEVRYFSLGPERIFERTRAVIGRKVQFCHPPSSVSVVEQILEDFKSGKKDSAQFWIDLQEKKVLIRYFAVRDGAGQYQGTLEVSENITDIQSLSGERRLYDYE